MIPPKPASALSDTGKQLEAVRAVFREEMHRADTPVTGHAASSSSTDMEKVREIVQHEADRTARAVAAEYQANCVEKGPICVVWDAIDGIRGDLKSMSTEMAEKRGADKAQARNLTLIVGLASAIGVAANVIGIIWKVRHP